MLQCSILPDMEPDPVPAFAALAHPHRLAVLRLLMRAVPGRLSAGEIGEALDLRPSTLSGYLAQLMEAGLVTQERRGTSLLYAAALEAAQALSAAWLGPITGGRGWPEGWGTARRVRNLLFVGQGNAGPSLLAEALLRQMAGERFEVFSAGLSPAGDAALLPEFAALGIDTGDLWPKPLSLWQGPEAPPMDVVITLGQRAAALPDWPGPVHRAGWRLAPGLDATALMTDLTARLAPLAALDPQAPPARLQAVLDAASFRPECPPESAPARPSKAATEAATRKAAPTAPSARTS